MEFSKENLKCISMYISQVLSLSQKKCLFSACKKKIRYSFFNSKSDLKHKKQSSFEKIKSYNDVLTWIVNDIGPFSLISYNLLDELMTKDTTPPFNENTVWKTEFLEDGQKIVEETFTLGQKFDTQNNENVKKEKVMVVGALGELYVANISNFIEKETKRGKKYFLPKGEKRCCIQLDGEVWNIMDKLCLPFKESSIETSNGRENKKNNSRNDKLYVPTSWGSYHLSFKNDYLILSSSGVYRIQKKVFELTYQRHVPK